MSFAASLATHLRDYFLRWPCQKCKWSLSKHVPCAPTHKPTQHCFQHKILYAKMLFIILITATAAVYRTAWSFCLTFFYNKDELIIVFISIFYVLSTYTVIPDVLCEVKVAAAECSNNVMIYGVKKCGNCIVHRWVLIAWVVFTVLQIASNRKPLLAGKRICGQLQRFDSLGFAHFTQLKWMSHN